MKTNVLRACFAICVPLAVAAGCSIPASSDRFVQTKLPDETTFVPASTLLVVRCGSLDCHGNSARNLRLYGSAGRRLAPGDQPLAPACNTAAEVHEDYVSVVGLEPERMSDVANGADPAVLTMMRKARGTEAHKGEQIWTTGDDSDVCVTSWLGGKSDAAACQRALAKALPAGDTDPLVQCAAP